MNKIKETIKTYIKYLSINEDTKSSTKEKVDILNFITSLDTDTINANMSLVAELFCRVIGTFNKGNSDDKEVIQGIINAFKNIKNMKSFDENNQKEIPDSYLMVLVFLKNLNDMNDIGFENTVLDEGMHSQFEELSEILESIRIVFKIEEENKVVFPLARLLSKVIISEKFKIDILDITTINTLLLALEVFSNVDYHSQKNQLTKLIDDCNIKCLKYLENSKVIKIDETNWKNNFKKNGVLILADLDKQSILIRHESKAYFTNIENELIENELNSDGIRIASYYEYSYDSNQQFISFEEIIKSQDIQVIFKALNLIYNKKNYNVFHKQAFIRSGSELKVVNPFNINDAHIIKEHNSSATVPSSVNSVTKDCLSKYYLEIIIQDGLNCACIGLICNLLEIEPLNPFDLLLNLNTKSSYQNQIINNWIKNTNNPDTNLIEIQSKFFSNLGYTSNQSDIRNAHLKGLFLYPLKFDEKLVNVIINKKFKFGVEQTYDFFKSRVTTSFDGVNKNIEIDGVIQNSRDVIYYDEDEDSIDGEEFFVIKTSDSKLHVSKSIDSLGKLNEKIVRENEKLIDYDSITKISEIQINYVMEHIKLHEKALISYSHNNLSFNSVSRIRLINNILYYRLYNDSKWEKLLEILALHKKITFETITNIVDSSVTGVLYVPKEVNESDSVFSSIVPTYLKNGYARTPDIYYNQLELVNSEYNLRGHKISEITILFDTLQSGTSTIRTLDFYFEKYGENYIGNQPNRTIIYYSNGKPVQLIEILRTNNAKLKVIFLNGTSEGKQKIEEYFTKLSIQVEITCPNNITLKADEKLINLSNELYGSCGLNIGNYPIIREFNQPKKNVFPNEMLDVERIFSLFVKKKEL